MSPSSPQCAFRDGLSATLPLIFASQLRDCGSTAAAAAAGGCGDGGD